LAGNILGTKDTISSIKSEDFKSYMHEWYGFKNVVLVVAGEEATVMSDHMLADVEKSVAKGGADRQAAAQKMFL
jgi:2-C-methyl-D-erythritol 4-phosphate cytidylyltransferase